VVAFRTTPGSQQGLVKGKQGFVDFVDVVIFGIDEILDNQIKGVAVGQGIAGPPQQIMGFVQIQLQGNGKGDGRCLAGAVVFFAADLGKQLPVNIGFFLGFHICHTLFINKPYQHF